MSDATYLYQLTGTATGEKTWDCRGKVSGPPGAFPDLLHIALTRAFRQLCEGEGVGDALVTCGPAGERCFGPFTITGFSLELEPNKGRNPP